MSDITKEIRQFISNKIDTGVIVRADWLTAEIIEQRGDINGGDLPFYRVCAFNHVREIVRSCIKKYKPAPTTDSQLVLPGFDHLQKSYFMDRDGESVLVPVDQCTDAELQSRAREYDDMARGCRAHAFEIRKYVEVRQPVEAA